METLTKSKNCLEAKYMKLEKLWQESERKLSEIKSNKIIVKTITTQTEIQLEHKYCITENLMENSANVNDIQMAKEILMIENEDIKKQLQKCKLDFEIFENEMQIENEKLKCKLEDDAKETENLKNQLFIVKGREEKLLKRISELEKTEIETSEINILYQCECESEKLANEENKKEKEFDLESAESEEIFVLRNRVLFFKNLLNQQSSKMVKLEADFNVLKNDNSILKVEMNIIENKAYEEICQLKKQLKVTEMELSLIRDNYQKVRQDFEKSQTRLLEVAEGEVKLQKSFTYMEKNYCKKVMEVEKEKNRLEDLANNLKEELDIVQKECSSKELELRRSQNMCKFYIKQLTLTQQDVTLREKLTKLESANCRLLQRIREYMTENSNLFKQKVAMEEYNCRHILELEKICSALMELKKECQSNDKSLACVTAESSKTAASKSEYYNESQFIISYIRTWMNEERESVDKLNSRLKSMQEQILRLEFEKKELTRINNVLSQIYRIYRPIKKTTSSISAKCCILPSKLSPCSSYNHIIKRGSIGPIRSARRTIITGENWWIPRLKHIVKEIRVTNEK